MLFTVTPGEAALVFYVGNRTKLHCQICEGEKLVIRALHWMTKLLGHTVTNASFSKTKTSPNAGVTQPWEPDMTREKCDDN